MSDINTDPKSPKAWLARIAACKQEREALLTEWRDSNDFHRGKPFATDSDADRIAVNKDWPRVKARRASLFGQMPEVRLLPKNDTFAAAVPVFAKELNDKLKQGGIFHAVYSCVTDNISSSGVGVAMVEYQRRTEPRQVPTVDPATAQQLLQAGQEVPSETIDWTTDERFSVKRLSPSELLWPVDCTEFDFDEAPWLGNSGVMTWAEAKNEFKLKDEDKSRVITDGKRYDETLNNDTERQHSDLGVVRYDQIFYWSYRFEPNEKSFKRIKRIVFVEGLDKPVIDEEWTGQRYDEPSGTIVGSPKFPIRVLKLAYVSDDPIPPSESAIGRPQVLELNEIRTHQTLQRQRNVPVRLFDVNAVDPEVQVLLQKGEWQGWLPVNGQSRLQNTVYELARSSYPAENMQFDRIINHDLDEVWQTSANQAGAFATGERSASEARIVQQNYDMRNGLDRMLVAEFITGIAEVMAGLLALYGNFEIAGMDGIQRMDQSWDRTRISQEFVFDVIPDSMVRLDAHQQIQMYMDILNMTAKSGFINPAPIIYKILSLAGEDPGKVMTQPNPPAAEPLNISIRNAEDLRDPIMLALLMKTGQAPSPQDLEAAKQLQLAAAMPPAPQPPVDPNALPPQEPTAPEAVAPSAPPNTATAPEEMAVMDKLNKRSDFD